MKSIYYSFIIFFAVFQNSFSQENDNAAVLKIILTKYYANEKPIVKNRLQLLSFYCNKAPNNEEVIEVISKSDILKKNASEIKKQIDITVQEDWNKEFTILFTNQHQYLKSKVQDCVSLEKFQEDNKKYGENNQRLMIASKPIYFGSKYCLVKVAFYRSIEHNSGSYLLFEKTNDAWIIKDVLNEWST
jgi:hypothetical protein